MNLHAIVRYLGISNANMDEGSFRADINISVRKKGVKLLGTKVELKNINSFKFVGQATEYEIERQIGLLDSGEQIHQETRQWDTKTHQTIFMRSKEVAQDYRYFTEPDLPLIQIDDAWIERIKKSLPESAYESDILIQDLEIANFFEAAAKIGKNPKAVCNWMLRDLLSYLKENKLELAQIKVTPNHMAALVVELDKGTINSKVAQEVFIEMASSGKLPVQIIQEKGLQQIDSAEEIEKVVLAIIAQSPDVVAKYCGGNERMFQFFVGQVMKDTKGKANPKIVSDLLLKHLKA
jgi:aspartyl-tRNA(Asn)/glutamyl-tRNA(Gln) amidotransferase subunit B